MSKTYNSLQDLLENNGYEVDVHTTGDIVAGTLENYDIYVGRLYNHNSEDVSFGYDPNEPDRLEAFVSNGGDALFLTEFGPAFSHPAYQFFLDKFDVQHSDNMVLDSAFGTFEGGKWVTYEKGRNFQCHPAINAVNKVQLKAAATVNSSVGGAVIYTSSDATPLNAPVIFAKRYGSGRIIVSGDTDWMSINIDNFDHKSLAVGIVDWIAGRRQ